MPVGLPAGEHPADGCPYCVGSCPSPREADSRDDGGNPVRCCGGCGGAGCMHLALQPPELPFLQGGEAHAAGENLQKAAGPGGLLPRAGEHLGGGAGSCGGSGPAGDVFRLLPAPVLLRHAGAPDAVWRAQLCELPGGAGAVPLRAADSRRHCGGAAVGQEAALQILGAVHRLGRHLPGEPARADHFENLPGGQL